jgi:hypothetical protein
MLFPNCLLNILAESPGESREGAQMLVTLRQQGGFPGRSEESRRLHHEFEDAKRTRLANLYHHRYVRTFDSRAIAQIP